MVGLNDAVVPTGSPTSIALAVQSQIDNQNASIADLQVQLANADPTGNVNQSDITCKLKSQLCD